MTNADAKIQKTIAPLQSFLRLTTLSDCISSTYFWHHIIVVRVRQ